MKDAALDMAALSHILDDIRDNTILNNHLMYNVDVGSSEYNSRVWGAVEDAFFRRGVDPAAVRAAFEKAFQIPGTVSDAPYSMDTLLDLFQTARDRVEGDYQLIHDTPVDSEAFRTGVWKRVSEAVVVHDVDDSFLTALETLCNVPAPTPEPRLAR